MTDCTVVVLTYKGKHHLESLLPTLRTAIQAYQEWGDIDVLIVDNGKDEKTRKYVVENYPEFKFEFSQVNDYLFSLNPFIEKLSSKYMLLLNDDMKLKENIFENLIPLIKSNELLFGVTCNVMDWNGDNATHGIREMAVSRGLISHYWKNYVFDDKSLYYTLYPAGGAAILDVKKFNELGGFDCLFRPAYCEDADIGIRAWYNGWPTLFSPTAIIYHREGGTINDQFAKSKLGMVQYRNMILWSLKNNKIPYSKLVFFIMLPYRLIYSLFSNRPYYYALIGAIPRLPEAFKKGNKIRAIKTTSDIQTLLQKNFKLDNDERDHLQRRKQLL